MERAIIAVTRENTKTNKPMWRMGMRSGDVVYVFDDNKSVLAEYPEIVGNATTTGLSLGETLYWDNSPITVEAQFDSKGWLKIHKVFARASTSTPNKRELLFDKQWVLDLYKQPFFIIDTETTGKEADSQVISIGLVNGITGSQHKWMIKPTISIPKEASDVHGIYDADVANAPTFGMIAQELLHIINGCRLIAYNSSFDQDRLNHEFKVMNIHAPIGHNNSVTVDCAMRAYANGGKWCKLSEALVQMGVVWDADKFAHDALADSIATLRLLDAMRSKIAIAQALSATPTN